MELLEKPSKRTPRSIPPELHENVWKLHLEGLDPPRIAGKLTADGCPASRHSVRRLVIQLNRAQTRDAHSEKIAEELKLSRASALALRDMHQESLNDVCDDLVIAARKDKYERTLALSRAGRILLRAVAHYDRLYQLALKQESRLPAPDPTPPIPDGAPTITSPPEGARIPNAMFYPNGLGVPNSAVDMTIDDIPLPPELCTPNNGQWFAPPFALKPGDHTFAVRYLDAPPSAPRSVVNFTIIGCVLFLLLSNLSCRAVSPDADSLVKNGPRTRADPLQPNPIFPRHLPRMASLDLGLGTGSERLQRRCHWGESEGRLARASGDAPASARIRISELQKRTNTHAPWLARVLPEAFGDLR